MDCEILTPEDWTTLRTIRLTALADSPTAYISSYDTESSWTEDQWRRSFVDTLWIVSRAGRTVIGIAHSVRLHGRPSDERHLESVWVDPSHRGTGVMRAMLKFLTEAEPSVRDWLVWVIDDNAGARAVYEKLGFEPTSEHQRLPDSGGPVKCVPSRGPADVRCASASDSDRHPCIDHRSPIATRDPRIATEP